MDDRCLKRLAIFVEGQTEVLLVDRLLGELAGKKGLTIEIQRADGGGKSGRERSFRTFTLKKSDSPESRYYVLIRSSNNDERVTSDIREQALDLAKKGYEQIMGLRDVYPLEYADIGKIENGIKKALKQVNSHINCSVFLSVMEVEAWFLAEEHHYRRMNRRLTPDLIKSVTGIDVMGNIELIRHPSDSLNQIYGIVGQSYRKKRTKVQSIVDKLNIENFYSSVAARVPHLGQFIQELDRFFD